ncbi:hypothetical protein I302_100007 [Kwoniella bestiolae CBS 10118]|uniref:Major facilitator superfamily (MFS) profile domain-containing protein n=1 Tax=Kwoniella bestiolae CBS 10118 TaxID=1296100 RepID=A0A1B9G3W9_9TREE|nr:hypothetical protein I302_03379 [Kwoniella bestiolae CBS 10118]OCF25706.1 hypothetical protein I302_03379 [Kwoniella bestiolae CBS 10118]
MSDYNGAEKTLAQGPPFVDQSEVNEAAYDDSGDNLADYKIDPAETRKLLRNLDFHIAPVVMILYLIAFLDRANIGNAAVGGMTKDLHFPANGLSLATSIFYVTYVLFETPATVLLRTLRPSRLIPIVIVVWGATVLGNGFAKSYGTVIACRLLLGMCEAALSPCLFLYMTTFYQRCELGLRMCYLFIASAISGVVGGLIATGFLKMNGLHGIAGWRWLFIIEGALTIGVGFIVAFFIPDKYEDARYLDERQMFLMKVREAQEAAYSQDTGFSWIEIRKALTDPVVYLSGFIQMCFDVCLYGFATFLVVIIKELGFSAVSSQAITAPVYFVAAVVYLFGALVSDRYSIRYWLIMPLGIFTTAGYVILISVSHGVGARLAGCFLAGMGIYIAVGLHITWLGQNIAGYRKRSTSVGLQQTFGNIGGIIAGQIYRSNNAPRYLLGHSASLAFWIVGLLCLTLEWYIWRSRNARREAMTQEEKDTMDQQGVTGDHHYSFRYLL